MICQMANRVVQTNDGSLTLYSSKYEECFHSARDGALRESLYKHVIVAFSLLEKKEKITILDICFGLGYNTLATVYYCKQNKITTPIEIISPELDVELIKTLESFEYPLEFDFFADMIKQLSQNRYYKDEQFEITILLGDARELLPKLPHKFDIIYQDAFSPLKNTALWTVEYFGILRKLSSPNVILTTYSSATPVRIGLLENGFLLYESKEKNVRSGTIASLSPLDLSAIDMTHKLACNPNATSYKDIDLP